LRLRAQLHWEDGTLDDVNIETLQPPEWVAGHQAEVGATVPIPLDLVEMSLPADMQAVVVTNESCPAIAAGAGRVVLTTVNHLHPNVCELTVNDAEGRSEKTRPTELHKFYRENDGKWVSAEELSEGERIRGRFGSLIVVSLEPVEGVHRVYNMTVEGEHVYYVSHLGILAHNIKCGSANPAVKKAANRGSTLHSDKPGNLPEQLRQRYPNTQFDFTKPGVTGQDARVVGGTHPSNYPGSNWPQGVDHGDFKPNTPGGQKTFKSDQKNKWSQPTYMLPYDPSTGQLQ